jgi:hypothetical protein
MRFGVAAQRFSPGASPADVDATAIDGDRPQLGR